MIGINRTYHSLQVAAADFVGADIRSHEKIAVARSDPSILQALVDRLSGGTRLASQERQALLDLPTAEMGIAARRDIYQAGEGLTHCSLVLSGVLARFVQNSKGERQLTALNISGEVADLEGIVAPRAVCGLTTLTPAVVAKISHESLRSVAERHSGIAEALWRECVAGSAHLPHWASLLARSTARARIANLLCHMARRVGTSDQPALTFAFPITQDQLAEATGLTSVHVNRTLRRLRMARIVTFRSALVTIHDWPSLAAEAELPSSIGQRDSPARFA